MVDGDTALGQQISHVPVEQFAPGYTPLLLFRVYRPHAAVLAEIPGGGLRWCISAKTALCRG